MTTRVKCIKQYLRIVLIKNFKEKENNNTNFLLWVIIMTKKQFHITYSALLAILLIASEAVIYILFGEKQLTDNAQISRLTGVVLIVPIILSFLKDFVLEKRQKLQLAFLDFCIAAWMMIAYGAILCVAAIAVLTVIYIILRKCVNK